MRRLTFVISVVLICFSGCENSTPPVVEQGGLSLTVEDISCAEAWLNLSLPDQSYGRMLEIFVNDSSYHSYSVENRGDTTLFIENLLPEKNYIFKTLLHGKGDYTDIEALAEARTMDTTSHDFEWEMFEIGDFNPCYFSDVEVINENDIWAVGEYYLYDSLGHTNSDRYNAAHWDGNIWNPERIEVDFHYYDIVTPLEGVYAFSSTNIWFAGSLPIHGNGKEWEMYDLRTTLDPELSVSHIMAVGTKEIYFAGRNGSIVLFDGTDWHKIESGTNLQIQDLWGSKQTDGNFSVYALYCDKGSGFDKKLLRLNSGIAEPVELPDIYWPVTSVWFDDEKRMLLCGSGVYQGKITGNSSSFEEIQPKISDTYSSCVRGTGRNDIFICGHLGSLFHFNGYSWKRYDGVEVPSFYGVWVALSAKENVVCAVGDDLTKAKMIIGRRK